jgi:hypothetical protein
MGGLRNLKVKNVYDDKLNVKSDGTTLEKGNKIRKFVIFPAMKQALEKYRDGEFGTVLSDKEYSLIPADARPGNKGNIKPYGEASIRRIIKNICKRAKVDGDHIHTHAFRKTVVVKLMNEGNTLDNVAKFIGHSSSAITAKHYWTPTQSHLIEAMNMSWLVGGTKTVSESTTDTTQMRKIVNHILEGLKAKKQLENAVSIMSEEQKNKMEELWNPECEEEITSEARNIIADIIKMNSTIGTSSYCSDD